MSTSRQPEKRHESVVVEIYDQQYHLRGTDTERIIELARLVDAKMRAVAAQCATADSLRVAVLTALNITDELMQVREQQGVGAGTGAPESSGSEALRERADSLNTMLDEVLGERKTG